MTKLKNDVLISIIIPVYNCENHLSSCLDSIIDQSYTNFEILIVDDGSTDKTNYVYNYYKNKDSRIRVIKQKNLGVSCARNKGIDNAKGEYLIFIDSDDMIKECMLEKLYKGLVENECDIAFTGFEVIGSKLRKSDTDVLLKICCEKSIGIISNEDAIERTMSTDPNEVLYGYIWRNLYKADILRENNIRFSEGIKISEDFMFILEVLDKCKNVVIIPEELYIYNINDSSVTSKYIDTLHNDMYFINEWMLNNICNKYIKTIEGYYCCVSNTYLCTIQNICRNGSPYSLKESIKLAYKLKKEYKYKYIINKVWKHKNKFRKKAWIAFVLFKFNLEFIYIILFKWKERGNIYN